MFDLELEFELHPGVETELDFEKGLVVFDLGLGERIVYFSFIGHEIKKLLVFGWVQNFDDGKIIEQNGVHAILLESFFKLFSFLFLD